MDVFEAHIHHAANGIIAIAGAAYNGDGERAEAAALGRLARPILLLDDAMLRGRSPCTRPDGVLTVDVDIKKPSNRAPANK